MPNVIFLDSFDAIATASLAQKYGAVGGAVSVVAGAGRNGTAGMRTTASSNSGNLTSPVLGNQATLYAEVAVRTAALGNITFLQFLQAGALQVDAQMTSTGELAVSRGGTVLATTSGLGLAANTFYHIGLMATIHDTLGVYELRVNGVTKLSATGVDTNSSGSAWADQVRLRGFGGLGADYDDLIVSTDGWCGDCRVVAVFPAGAGNYSQWTPSAGSGWQCVDEAAPNGDTDYVSSATAGQRNSYDFAALGLTGAIKAVQHVTSLRKDDVGARTVKQFARIGGTDYDGADAAVLDTYAMQRRVMSVNPATGADWTVAALDASEFGTLLVS